jgi:hypothetical protein
MAEIILLATNQIHFLPLTAYRSTSKKLIAKFFSWDLKYGVKLFPVSFTATHNVTIITRSLHVMKPICFFPISAMILFRACTHVKHIMPFEFVFIKNLTHILRKSIDTPVIEVSCPCVNSCLWMPYGDSGIYFQKSIQPDCASHFSFAQLLRKFQLAVNCTLIRKRSQISSWQVTIQIAARLT